MWPQLSSARAALVRRLNSAAPVQRPGMPSRICSHSRPPHNAALVRTIHTCTHLSTRVVRAGGGGTRSRTGWTTTHSVCVERSKERIHVRTAEWAVGRSTDSSKFTGAQPESLGNLVERAPKLLQVARCEADKRLRSAVKLRLADALAHWKRGTPCPQRSHPTSEAGAACCCAAPPAARRPLPPSSLAIGFLAVSVALLGAARRMQRACEVEHARIDV